MRAPRPPAPRRYAPLLLGITLLLIVGGFDAAEFRAGVPAAAPAVRTELAAKVLARRRVAAFTAARTTATLQRALRTRATVVRRKMIAVTRSTIPAPTPAPTTCAAVVSSIGWPSGWRVACAGPSAGLLGTTEPGGLTTLFVRSDETMSWLRVVALHEAGHAWDLARLNGARIEQWCAMRGCDAGHFFAGGASSAGWAQPGGAEDWASSWDACHGGEYARSYIGLAPPTPSQCALQNALVGYPG